MSQLLLLTLQHRWAGSKDEERSYSRARRLIEDHSLAKIDPADIRGRRLLDLRDQIKQGRAPATANRFLAALSTMLRVHEEVGGPAAPRIRSFREAEPRSRVLTRNEENRLSLTASGDLMGVLLDTGLRIGELLSRPEVSTLHGRQIATVRGTKNGVVRVIPLTDRAARGMVRTWPSETSLRRTWRTSCTEAKISGVSFHTLRHTCATRLAEAGVPIPVIQRWLGHTDVATTMRYVHPNDAAVVAALEKL